MTDGISGVVRSLLYSNEFLDRENVTISDDLLSNTAARAIANDLSPLDLAACAQETIVWQDSRVTPTGALRSLAARFQRELGLCEFPALELAEVAVFRECTLRYIAQQTGERADKI